VPKLRFATSRWPRVETVGYVLTADFLLLYFRLVLFAPLFLSLKNAGDEASVLKKPTLSWRFRCRTKILLSLSNIGEHYCW